MYVFMNETEDIYVMKTVNAPYEKYVIPVTRRNARLELPLEPAGAYRQCFGCSRWPRWWSSWITVDGRPGRWGSATVGVRKGPHQAPVWTMRIRMAQDAVTAKKQRQYYLVPAW